jgi:hemoglobin
LLAPIFEGRVQTEEQWEQHFIRMTDFWETVLFAKIAYTGNPFSKHVNIGIVPEHFTNWVALFQETVDAHFAGEKADETKERVHKMRKLFELKLFDQSGAKHIF